MAVIPQYLTGRKRLAIAEKTEACDEPEGRANEQAEDLSAVVDIGGRSLAGINLICTMEYIPLAGAMGELSQVKMRRRKMVCGKHRKFLAFSKLHHGCAGLVFSAARESERRRRGETQMQVILRHMAGDSCFSQILVQR